MSKISIALLGALQVSRDGAPLTQFESVKVRALLAYLAAEAGKPHDRGKLAGLLWPGWPQEAAQKNLRHALYSLRKLLGDPPYLEANRQSVRLSPGDDCQVDTLALEAALNRLHRDPAQAGSLSSWFEARCGPFLDGFTLADSPEYEEWVLSRSAYHNRQMLEAFSLLADWHEALNNLNLAETFARRQLELEPWREEAHQQLMRALARQGQRSQALAQYEACRKALDEGLGAQPGAETTRLHALIQSGQYPAGQYPPEPTAPAPAPRGFRQRPRHNLPRQVTPLVGRERETRELQARLASAPLVTITGPGGMGKSRLALHIAETCLERYADGAWWVDLAPLSSPELVPLNIARSVDMVVDAKPEVLSALLAYLQPRQLLVVLDNCEHLVEACAQVADAILRACPQVTLLATSREVLGIVGEALYPLSALSFPDLDRLPGVEQAAGYAAVHLFALRAEAARPGFKLDAGNILAVAQVCAHLDGIPLAIELAAARVAAMQVEEIAARLGDCFALLAAGRRAALPRHQTLRASIEWSYNLLSPAEQRLLQRCSVFAGDWSLEAAEAVGCDQAIVPSQVLSLLSQLADKSLVSPSFRAGQPTRYRLLETIQRFAAEKLAEARLEEDARDHHLLYYLALAERAKGGLRSPEMPRLLELLEAELENIRRALDYALIHPGSEDWRLEAGLRVASALHFFWHPRNRHAEGLNWLERLLAAEEAARGGHDLPTRRIPWRAKALYVAAWMANYVGNYTRVKKYTKESQKWYRTLGPAGRCGLAAAQMVEGSRIFYHQGDIQESKRLLEKSRAVFLEEGDLFNASEACLLLGMIAMYSFDYETAQSYDTERLKLAQALGDPDGIAFGQFNLGLLCYRQGNEDRARRLFEQSMEAFRSIHHTFATSLSIYRLIELEGSQGHYARAEELAEELVNLGEREGNELSIYNALVMQGWLAVFQDQVQKAVPYFARGVALKGENWLADFLSPLFIMGILAWLNGETDLAAEKFRELLALSQSVNNSKGAGIALWWLGRIAFDQGDLQATRACLIQALENCIDTFKIPWDFIYALETVADVEFALGQPERAVRLLAATDAYHQRHQFYRISRDRNMRSEAIAALRRALGEAAFSAAWEAGAALSLDEAVAYALANSG
jgi:predicted ATPase/DNA-binding SARP family transcriptional activator